MSVCIRKIFKYNFNKTDDISQKVGIYSFNMMHERRKTFVAWFFYTVYTVEYMNIYIYIHIKYGFEVSSIISFKANQTSFQTSPSFGSCRFRGALFLPEIR